MAWLVQLFIILSVFGLISSSSDEVGKVQPYVVYMGSPSPSENEESDHLQLLSSIIPREESERVDLIHHYKHALKGFSAMLTPNEAALLAGKEEVVSVFSDPILRLHTTRSWDFLESTPFYDNTQPHFNASTDVIIGIIDTGIWPESESFEDKGLGPIPSRWKGVCMESSDFNKSHCNRKLIGARYYKKSSSSSPRDPVGHGSHVAAIAGGAHVRNANYYGLAAGTARGGSPGSRIATYKACSEDGCSGSTILKAIDDAIYDGVDLISISIGISSFFQNDFLNDPIAIGAFHAHQFGVMVVSSAGNDGPDPSTVVNTAPWLFTVAASTIDRDFRSTLLLNNTTFPGSGIHFSNLSETFPLAYGQDIAARLTPVSEAMGCYPGSLDPAKVEGKIVLCFDNDPTLPNKIRKLVVEDAGAKGLIMVSQDYKQGVPFDSGTFAFTQVDQSVGSQIVQYINSTKNPTATILPTTDVPMHKPAPIVPYFSSRGPGQLTENILKPDISAPGVAILSAVIPKGARGTVPVGKKPTKYATRSGTSMACPHVTGAAAFVRSVHHHWTPSMIKSALMTTATVYDNLGKPLKNNTGNYATPHDMGVGEISPIKALDPGLVFETTTLDYFNFLCYYGYSERNIRTILKNVNFKCPKKSADKLISNINYPSISIASLGRGGVTTIRRRVRNVGSSSNATYIAKVHSPSGLVVKVSPDKIGFNESMTRVSFKVAFYSKAEDDSTGYKFGSITWSDGRHSVRMVFAVNVD